MRLDEDRSEASPERLNRAGEDYLKAVLMSNEAAWNMLKRKLLYVWLPAAAVVALGVMAS